MDMDHMTPEQLEMMKAFGDQMRARMEQEHITKARNYRVLNKLAKKGAILFTGSSLMENFAITEMAMSAGIETPVYNPGIGGTTTDDFLREIDAVLYGLEPAKVFINIGTNDMTDRMYGEAWMDHLAANYEKILQTAKEKIPNAMVYCMAYYPANTHLPGSDNPFSRGMLKDRTVENITECNRRVEALAKKYGYRYINVNEGLYDENGEQKAEFSIDGVHMYADAYEIVFKNLLPYINEES